MLYLTRPLVLLDLEATGTSVKHDRIVEIAIVKALADGTAKARATLVNPERRRASFCPCGGRPDDQFRREWKENQTVSVPITAAPTAPPATVRSRR